jgi:acyl-CoA synthetase (AMP-forming)/AMP-acid ligase II/alkylation response protein AidB-like acyl-CoA dehydrogenase
MTGTLVEIAARRAREQGNSFGYVFLSDGEIEAARLTFAQLDAAARECAARLLKVAKPGDRALLVYEAGLDFVAAFYACLYAGLIAAPLPAPEASRLKAGLRRLEAVARDCDARLLLGTARTHEMLRDFRPSFTSLGDDCWIDTQKESEGKAAPDLPFPALDSLAYLQYTSGSTATPKGVMVSHRNLTEHLGCIQEALDYDANSVSVSWMPHFHDYGLVQGILLPLFNGTPAYLMSPFAFLKRPRCWLEAISKYRGTHTEGAGFAYRYCSRRVTQEQRAGLDLRSLKMAGNGGEPIHPDTCPEFYRTFAPCGLRLEALSPAYGLAEATLMLTASPVGESHVVGRFDARALAEGAAVPVRGDAADGLDVVGCGRPIPRTEIVIVNPETCQPLGSNRVGEIWVAAPGVAQGYWMRPQESAEVFRAHIAGDGSAAYLRTGDLGFLHDGQVFITGRAKDLIIIHGMNYSPQDLEWTVQQAHPALRADNGAAFSIPEDGEEHLCIVQELERGKYSDAELDAILSGLVQAVADAHSLVVHSAVLIKRGSLPKTTSGKIQRSACRQAYLEGWLQTVRVRSLGAGEGEPVSQSAKSPDEAPQGSAGEERSTQRADSLIEWLREYAEHRINSRLIDERRCVPPSVILDFGNRGIFGLQVPGRLGGLELSHHDAVRVFQQLGAVDLSLATLVFLHNTNGIRPVLSFASPAMRDELMPALAAGRELAAFALSEPGAGSNLGAIRARAETDGAGGWVLHGVKRWNGSAWAGVINVFARLVDSDGRLRGLTGFVLRQSDPGLRLGPEALTMGMRGIMQNTLHLDGARVSQDRLLGEAAKGMQVVEHVLSYGRLATAAVAIGATLRCAQLIQRYTSRREIETGILLHNPQAAVRVSELVHRVTLDQALLSHGAKWLDAGNSLLPEIAMALKIEATENLNRSADVLMQLLGGRGYMENNLAPQMLRDARALSIGEGANESLLAAIGRGSRMGDSLQSFLAAYDESGTLPKRMAEMSAPLDRRGAAGAFSGDAAVAWRDAQMGRLACAALHLATARALAGRDAGHLQTQEWAQMRFDRVCQEIEKGPGGAAAVLPPDLLEQRIADFRQVIGDIEPLAPDVDSSLDPLLRREAQPQAEVPRAEQTEAAAESVRLREKKEKLRRLLQAKPQPREKNEGD